VVHVVGLVAADAVLRQLRRAADGRRVAGVAVDRRVPALEREVRLGLVVVVRVVPLLLVVAGAAVVAEAAAVAIVGGALALRKSR